MFILTACGGDKKDVEDSNSTKVEESITEQVNTIEELIVEQKEPKLEVLDLNTSFKPSHKTVTIYVHGYRQEGFKKEGDYGLGWYNTFSDNLQKFTNLPMKDYTDIENYDKDNFYNFLTSIDYYGKTMPSYYTQKDADEIEEVSKKYGGGIPKYALVVAKYSRYLLEETGADRINIISVSMGSLVTRWLIEKNLENLVSDKKIEKWMSVEGVVRGNYALSQVSSSSIMNLFFTHSPETEHMKYKWIEENLNPYPNEMNIPYYDDILVGQISLTDGKRTNSLLKYVLPLYGGFQPNDGFQLLKDTYFDTIKNSIQIPSHTILHGDHIEIKKNYGSFATISSFLEAKKRVRLTLIDTTVTDIHEEITSSNQGSEIVFESQIYSSIAKERWNIEDAIDQRVYDSGALKIHNYNEVGVTYTLDKIIFDGFVLDEERELEVRIGGYEIDRSSIYYISETNKISKKESLGEAREIIKLESGIYDISAEDWKGKIKVEIFEM
jgi:hypothetical protein